MKKHIPTRFIYTFLKYKIIFSFCSAVIFFTGLIIIQSCGEQENTFTIGSTFLEQNSRVVLIDTFRVELSTVQFDSIATSGTGVALCGRYSDNEFGIIECKSFFQIGIPSSSIIENNEVYDSVTIMLTFSGYTYGDTIPNQKIQVHQLTENIVADNSGYLYNTSSVDYKEEPIGFTVFKPWVNIYESIEFRIDDNLGLELFEMLKYNASQVSSNEAFTEYFKGLVITTDENDHGVIVGFNAGEGAISLTLYSHIVKENLIENSYDFTLYNYYQQFNQINYDRSGTLLSDLTVQDDDIPSIETEDKTFIQSGTGLVTKIQFPTLGEFLLMENSAMLKAELVIAPVINNYTRSILPDSVIIIRTDIINRTLSQLYNNEGEKVTGKFIQDDQYNEQTSYTFDITDFLQAELKDSYFDYSKGLLLAFPENTFISKLNTLIIESDSKEFNAPRLKIQVLVYDEE
ncbi:MAG: DUF4270 family protein [Bacteroidales bacterium]|nr:DUF4270 family protein [Bacteroidales bacterium]